MFLTVKLWRRANTCIWEIVWKVENSCIGGATARHFCGGRLQRVQKRNQNKNPFYSGQSEDSRTGHPHIICSKFPDTKFAVEAENSFRPDTLAPYRIEVKNDIWLMLVTLDALKKIQQRHTNISTNLNYLQTFGFSFEFSRARIHTHTPIERYEKKREREYIGNDHRNKIKKKLKNKNVIIFIFGMKVKI